MSTEYLLALDAGSGSGRSVLISADGRECHTAVREWGYQYEPDAGPMACHFDPDLFWSLLASTISEVLAKAGADGRQVIGVSSTSQREGCVLIDGRGVELYAGPNRDQRAHKEGVQIATALGDEIYARSGHYPSGMFAPARLRWLMHHRPAVYEQAAKLLMINDWVLFRLSGEAASEPTNAAETCLFDLRQSAWADDLIHELDLRRDLFAEIVQPGTRIGGVSAAAASATGLRAGTPVVAGGADTQCGVLGSGAIQAGDLAVIAGTTAPLQLVLPELALDPQQRLWSGRFLTPGDFVLESNAGAAGTVYRWFRDTFSEMEIRRSETEGRSAFALIDELAESVPVGAEGARSFLGVVIMNARRLAMPRATLELGSLMWTGRTKAGIARAILESLAFAARANADQIAEVAPIPVQRVAACGGLTTSAIYLTLLSACLDRPIRVPRWREGSGVGATVCAAVGAGVCPSLEAGQRQLVTIETEVEADAALKDAYRDLYSSWLREYRGLSGRGADTATQVEA